MDLVPSWHAEQWNALGNVLLGVGALVAGAWSIFNYRKNRRAEAARWLQGVFRDFYLEDRFREIKLVMEYAYSDKLGPLLERRVTNADVPVTEADATLLEQLDTLLNYFEHVIYLERERHLTKRDRQAVFEYWFDLMEQPNRAAVRRYAAWFGFERVALALKCQKEDFIVLYGSLMSGTGAAGKPDLSRFLRPAGDAVLRGDLFDLGDYPGLKEGAGEVQGELYEVLDRQAFEVMDKFERYDAARPEDSLYVRRAIRLIEPDADAWVYVYNYKVNGAPQIREGSWAAHVAWRAATGRG
jgi:gamma-glutamylcyclotransferase (GGCT)/AIG2-like uncharacterized protein YtfP